MNGSGDFRNRVNRLKDVGEIEKEIINFW